MENRIAYDKEQVQKLDAEIAALPEGKLRCYANGDFYTWMWILGNNERKVIPKTERSFAGALARKGFLENNREKFLIDINALEKYLKVYKSIEKVNERFSKISNPEFCTLAGEYAADEDAKAWEAARYPKSCEYPENLIIKTIRGDLVRSKFEAMVANILFRMGLPYRYEQIHTFGKSSIATDFTILDPRTNEEVLLECYGMLERGSYRETYIRKHTTYVRNGKIPGINMLEFFETDTYKFDELTAERKLKDFFYG